MAILGHTYQVLDGAGRNWGTVVLRWEQPSPLGSFGNGPQYSGHLIPSKAFAEVRPLFERFDAVFGDPARDSAELDTLTDQINELNVELVSANQPQQVVKGIVMVDEKLLLTCLPRVRPTERSGR